MTNEPGNDDTSTLTISITKPDGTTWTKIINAWWLMPAAFAAVFGIPLLLCFAGVLLGRR